MKSNRDDVAAALAAGTDHRRADTVFQHLFAGKEKTIDTEFAVI
jgi:hypothetical protein